MTITGLLPDTAGPWSSLFAFKISNKIKYQESSQYLSDVHLSPQQHFILDQFLNAYGKGFRGLPRVLAHAIEDEIVPLVLLEVIHLLVHLRDLTREGVQHVLKRDVREEML